MNYWVLANVALPCYVAGMRWHLPPQLELGDLFLKAALAVASGLAVALLC